MDRLIVDGGTYDKSYLRKYIEKVGSRHPAILRGTDIQRHTAIGKCRNTNPEHYTVVRGNGYISKESKKEFVPVQAVKAHKEAMAV